MPSTAQSLDAVWMQPLRKAPSPPRGPEEAEVAEVTGATGARGQASRACLVAAGSEQVVSKGIIGFYSALFKKKGQAIELCRLIRLN